MSGISDVVRALVGQERALSNARAATTRLLRRRVERQDVELFLADREAALEASGSSEQEDARTREARRG